jgi:hypothetical protein
MKIFIKTITTLFVYMAMGLSLLGASNAGVNEHKWIKGELQAIYSTSYKKDSNQTNNVQYYLAPNRIDMLELNLTKLATSIKLEEFISKDVEIKVSIKNYEEVKAKTTRAYIVLDLRHNTLSQNIKVANALKKDRKKMPWINLLCKFSDIEEEKYDHDFIHKIFDDTYPFLGHYWNTTTYGRIDISGTHTIDNWVSLPHNRSYYVPNEGKANLIALKSDCIKAAGVEDSLESYAGINLFFNAYLDGAAWGGSYTTWLPIWANDSLGVIAHEMGHAYGLPHSNGSDGGTYSSTWDVMSNTYGGPNYGSYSYIPKHTIAHNKKKLGAIDAKYQWNNSDHDASDGVEIHISRLEELPESDDN